MLNRFRTFRHALLLFVLILCVLSFVSTILVWVGAMTLQPGIRLVPMYPFMPVMLSALFMVIAGAFLSKRAIRPFSDITDAMNKVAKGDFSVRVPEEKMPGEGEMRSLVHSFNTMAEELSSMQMFREDFIHTFSHEFKTPIVSIRGFAKRLRNPDLPPDKREEYLEFIINESERLSQMSGNILLLTRYENQSIITGETAFDLDEQIRECVLAQEPAWSKKNISLDVELEEMRCVSNEEMISHIWSNLIGNAIRFTGENGSIAITGGRVGDEWRVSVKDNGIGMSERTRQHIFDKFYQAGGERGSSGCGLGLALVARILALAQGRIEVKSEPEQGSEFIVYLPVREEIK